MAPMLPSRTALPRGTASVVCANMKVVTMSPIPKTAPRLTRVVTCHFLKYLRNPLSVPSGMMAGLSER
jgi:hypothetical protein